MVQREVDVVIKGRNTVGPAFRGARADIDLFSRSTSTASTGVGRLQNSLGNLLTQVSGLPGPVGKLAQSLGQFAVGGGITVALLGGIALIGRAFQQMEERATAFTNRMRGIGQQTREALTARIDILEGREANLAANREGSGRGRGDYGFDGSQVGIRRRQRELEETRKLLGELRVELVAIDRATQRTVDKKSGEASAKALEKTVELFDKKILPQLGTGSTRPGILSSGVGVIGEGAPVLGAIGAGAGVGPIMAEQIGAVEGAVLDLSDSIRGTAKDAIIDFASTWADATQQMITGSGKLGDAIVRAGRRAVGGVLMAKGRETLLDAAKAAVQGFTNPAEFVKAAKLFAIGTAQTAAGQLFAGGGSGGGGGGLGAGGFSDQRNETSDRQGDATIVIQGGILDTGDARQMDALAAAIRELGGTRRIQIVGD